MYCCIALAIIIPASSLLFIFGTFIFIHAPTIVLFDDEYATPIVVYRCPSIVLSVYTTFIALYPLLNAGSVYVGFSFIRLSGCMFSESW